MDRTVPITGPAARAPREAGSLTAGLREEHDTILRAVAVLERLGRRPEVLFPMADALLPAEEQRALADGLEAVP